MGWFFLHLVGSACWLGFAVGWVAYEPWVATVAFCFLALNSLLAGMKILVEVASGAA